VLERTALLEGNLANAVSEGRGFLLDPIAERRSRVEANLGQLQDDIGALTELTTDNAVQREAIAQLVPLIDARVAALRDIMKQATTSELTEIARIFRTATAMPIAVRIHGVILDMRNEERRLLTDRGSIAKGASRNLFLALVGCGLLASICMGTLVVVLLRRRQEQASSQVELLHLAELRREQDRFRAAVKAVHGVLWTNDAQGWMFGEQPGWAALTGQTYAQYQGFGWAAAVHPDDAEPTIEAWSAAVADRRVFVFEHRVRCVDGGYRTFAVRAAPVLDGKGDIREWVGVHTDVTAERSAELTNIYLAAIVTVSQDALISFAPDDGRILTWNMGAERLFGYSQAEAIGSAVSLLLPPDLREGKDATGIFLATKSGASIVDHETLRQAKSGEVIPVAVTATRMLDANGRLLGVSGTFHDLRPRRRIETALREANVELEQRVRERTTELVASEGRLRDSEAGYRLLAEHGSDVVARLSPDSTWQYVSPAVVHVLGHASDALLGRSPVDIVHPEDQAEMAAFLSHLHAGEPGNGALTVRICHPDRGEVWIEMAARIVHDGLSGQSVGCVAAIRDVTDRRKLELERESQALAVRAANDGLEQSNRSLDRLARHLARARDQANAASRAKSRFLASMSHELRTPLNGILGYAHLIRADGGLNPVQASRIETMLGAGQHLLEMISGILSLSEVEQQHVTLQPTTVNLGKLASECIDVVRPLAVRKNLALSVEIGSSAPATAAVDPTRLRQILLNLLGNAVKFTPSGAVSLRLHSANLLPNQNLTDAIESTRAGTFRFEVTDTGPGIPLERRERLFRDFERLDTDPDAIEGAGLGLALSARLATLMGGSIGYADNHDGGSVFWVEFPLREPESRSEQGHTPTVSNPCRRVLVVDDVAMNRDIAAAFLQPSGYDVTCLDNGADAITAVAGEHFDVVLMDVRMPGMDGLEATRRIRALPAPHGQVPVIALTAQAFAEQVAECRDAGMGWHLAKPFAPDALCAAVAEAVETGHTRVVASEPPVTEQPDGDRAIVDDATFDLTSSCLPPEEVRAYLQGILERADSLGVRLARFDPASPGHDSEIASLAHALAGSAGLFGFNRLSDAAQSLEYALTSGIGEPNRFVAILSTALAATAPELSHRITGLPAAVPVPVA